MKNWFKRPLAYFRKPAPLGRSFGWYYNPPPPCPLPPKSRTWYSGPPPHIGWWNASKSRDNDIWRWWDGMCWSQAASPTASPIGVKYVADRTDSYASAIKWTDYYPQDARVPRINPQGGSHDLTHLAQ